MQSSPAKTLVDVQSGLKFVKSPRWFDQKLLFLDVHDRSIKSTDLQGTVQTIRDLSFLPGSFAVLGDGEVIVGDAWQRKIYRLEGTVQKQAADLSDSAAFCIRDGLVDKCGGMYFADAGYDFLNPLADPVSDGVIVHVSSNGKPSVVAENLLYPGGMTITPNNKSLIVAETLGHRLTAFEIESDGSLHNRRVWAQFQNEISPEGICLDKEGGIWVAGSGLSAVRVSEGGEIDQRIATTRPVFAVALGGPQRKHLFLCTSGSNDPVITRQTSNATIEIAEVAIPGVEFAGKHTVSSRVTERQGTHESHLSEI